MSPTLLYLLKANVALLLFAAAYFGLLRRLTFFTLNRFYLLFALLFSAAYPALPVPALLSAEATPTVLFAVSKTAGGLAALSAPAAPTVDWAAVGVALYAAGVTLMLLRLLVQLLSLQRLRRRARRAIVAGQPVRVLAGTISPFSFGRGIYLNPAQHPGPELAAVLRHEQVHVRQWHTLDVLLAQVAQAAAWCNPAAWLLVRALLDNLEYVADQAVLQTGLDRRAYQYSLLRLSHAPAGPSLVSHFTFPTLKNRVLMMNTPLSSTGQLARYFVAGPLVLLLSLGYSAARAQQVVPMPAQAPKALPANLTYYVDGRLADKGTADNVKDIESMNILKGQQQQQVFGNGTAASSATVLITTKAKANTPAVLAFNKRVNEVVQLVPATPEQNATIAAAKTYVAQKHPSAKLSGVTILNDQPPRYRADFTEAGKPVFLLFDANGRVMADK